MEDGPVAGVGLIRYGGGGAKTRLVCGFLELAELMSAPLFRSLPSLLIEHTGDDPVSDMLAGTTAKILRQVDNAAPGTPMLLGRLMELLFVEVLRRHAARLPTRPAACWPRCATRWLRARYPSPAPGPGPQMDDRRPCRAKPGPRAR